MKDIKELALKVAKDIGYWDEQEEYILDFATRLIAAYAEGQEPVLVISDYKKAGRIARCTHTKYGETVSLPSGTKLFTAPPEPAPRLPEGCMWAVTKGGHSICQPPKSFCQKGAAPSSEEVQWRNIKHVVRTLADWAFGGKDDPRWGTAWVAMVNGLTAKDGPTFNLERLAARVPYGCVVVGWLDGRGRFFYADDPMYKNNHKGMREVIAAGEVKP